MRLIDRIIKQVRESEEIPIIQRQVLIARIEKEPTREEIDAARRLLYPEA